MNLNFTCLHEDFSFGKKEGKNVGAKVDRFEKRAAMTVTVKKTLMRMKKKKKLKR